MKNNSHFGHGIWRLDILGGWRACATTGCNALSSFLFDTRMQSIILQMKCSSSVNRWQLLHFQLVGKVLRSTCMYVCLSVSSHISETMSKFSVHVTYGRGSILLWWQCNMLCLSGLVDDDIFLHNGANEPKSSTTLRLSSMLSGGTGGEVCSLWLHLV